ncbi:uncharacterized protein LOC133884506 [Phragmites australis]|uniref:uncharacterized protein LOC133884506 n=1 Tax=Phragmites australis TaxID=29695 RepID=UPI002D7856F4|nr:uncharacterized protein LOC133884506 [Phragmites australis]
MDRPALVASRAGLGGRFRFCPREQVWDACRGSVGGSSCRARRSLSFRPHATRPHGPRATELWCPAISSQSSVSLCSAPATVSPPPDPASTLRLLLFLPAALSSHIVPVASSCAVASSAASTPLASVLGSNCGSGGLQEYAAAARGVQEFSRTSTPPSSSRFSHMQHSLYSYLRYLGPSNVTMSYQQPSRPNPSTMAKTLSSTKLIRCPSGLSILCSLVSPPRYSVSGPLLSGMPSGCRMIQSRISRTLYHSFPLYYM